MAWWLKNNLRLIQNNLRDIDGAMDVDSLVATLKEFDCNVVRVNAGGITSFYPSKLEFQTPSPYLNGRDTLGEIVEKCHAAGIRVIGRFDFSKTHDSFYEDHKDWYFRNPQGEIIHYNDTVQTCLNGWYQQVYSLEVLKEALGRYALDGVFFNMFGFHSWDYSGNRHGICHCDNCQKRFKEYTGGAMGLPMTESVDEPSYAVYETFKREMVLDILDRIRDCIKSFGSDIAICTGNSPVVDIIHNESNSALERPYPFQLMHSSNNVSRVRHNHTDKIISNCVINTADLWWRFTGVSEHLTAIRLYENIASGSGLDFCIIGAFEGYPDSGSVESAKKIFNFHKKNEQYYGNLESQAKLVLVQPQNVPVAVGGSKENLGIFRALKEEHIPFDILSDQHILQNPDSVKPYAVAIVCGLMGIDQHVITALRDAGVKTIVTGVTAPLAEEVAQAIGLQITQTDADTKGAYLHTGDKEVFRSLPKRDWIVLTNEFGYVDAPGWKAMLPLVSKAWFGPPERAFGHQLTDHGSLMLSPDKKTAIYVWKPGELFHQYGAEDYKFVLTDFLDWFAPEVRVIQTDAHSSVEIFWDRSGDHMFLQLLNLSGFNGTTVVKPLPIRDINVVVPFKAKSAETLCGGKVHLEPTGDGCRVSLDLLEQFEAIVLR